MAKARAKRRTEKLTQQVPEAVLGAHKLNYDIPYAEVRNARMDDPDIVATGTLEVETAAGNEAFSRTDEDGYREHGDLLRKALKEKLQSTELRRPSPLCGREVAPELESILTFDLQFIVWFLRPAMALLYGREEGSEDNPHPLRAAAGRRPSADRGCPLRQSGRGRR